MHYTAFEVLVIPACRGVLLGMFGGLVVLTLTGLLDTLVAAGSRARMIGTDRAFRAVPDGTSARREILARR